MYRHEHNMEYNQHHTACKPTSHYRAKSHDEPRNGAEGKNNIHAPMRQRKSFLQKSMGGEMKLTIDYNTWTS